MLRENSKQLETTHLFDMKRELPRLDAKLVDETARFTEWGGDSLRAHGGRGGGAAVSGDGVWGDCGGGGVAVSGEWARGVDVVGVADAGAEGLRGCERGDGAAEVRGADESGGRRRGICATCSWITRRITSGIRGCGRCSMRRGVQTQGYRAEQWAYLPARLEDNPYMREDYRDTDLAGLSEVRYKQLAEGNWHTFAGAFFPEWAETMDGQPWHVRRFAA